MRRLSVPLTISSISDFQTFLNHDDLDNLTVIFFDKDQPHLDLATRLLSHQTKHPILRVESDELAAQLKLTPGKLYLYSKPSVLLD